MNKDSFTNKAEEEFIKEYKKGLTDLVLFGEGVNRNHEMILLKTIKDKMEFEKEVKSLAKYFNAKIIYDKI